MKKLLGIVLGTFLVLVMVLTSISCGTVLGKTPDKSPAPSATQVSLGKEFILQVGQNVTATGEDLAIKFLGVTADSRAPLGVQAIWAGEAQIQLEITYQGSTFSQILTEKGLTDDYTRDYFNHYEFSFRLLPYPEVDKQPAAGDYKLVMKIASTDSTPPVPGTGIPIIDNRAVVRGEVMSITRIDSPYPWQLELRVQSVENVGTLPNLVAGKEGQSISFRTAQDVSLIKVGQVISANVSLSGNVERGVFLVTNEILG